MSFIVRIYPALIRVVASELQKRELHCRWCNLMCGWSAPPWAEPGGKLPGPGRLLCTKSCDGPVQVSQQSHFTPSDPSTDKKGGTGYHCQLPGAAGYHAAPGWQQHPTMGKDCSCQPGHMLLVQPVRCRAPARTPGWQPAGTGLEPSRNPARTRLEPNDTRGWYSGQQGMVT